MTFWRSSELITQNRQIWSMNLSAKWEQIFCEWAAKRWRKKIGLPKSLQLTTPISRRKNYFNSVGKDTSRYVQKFKRSLCHWPFILASQSLTEALKSCLKSFYVSAIKQDDTFYKKKKSTWAAMDAFSTCIPYADRLISTWKRFSLDYFRLYKAFKLSECLLFHWRTLKVTQRSLFYIHQPAWSCKSCYCLERKLPLFTGRC